MSDALVNGVRRPQLKVLGAVIARVFVPMVDNLTRFKTATDHPLHHKPMLPNVAMAISLGMVGLKY